MTSCSLPTIDRPATDWTTGLGVGNVSQVVLHNDDRNTMDYVATSLVRVFGHTPQLAHKIMLEAHQRGWAVAEVEPEESARKHCRQLLALGLEATVEPV